MVRKRLEPERPRKPRVFKVTDEQIFRLMSMEVREEGAEAESYMDTIVLVGQNLMFLPRIQMAASPLDCQVQQARTADDFWGVYQKQKPALVLVDLEGDEETWPRVVEGIRQRGDSYTRIIAFGPHTDVALMEKAKELGCDATYSKGQFNRDIAKIIQGQDGRI